VVNNSAVFWLRLMPLCWLLYSWKLFGFSATLMACVRRFLVFIIVVLHDVLNNYRDSPVGGIEWSAWFAQPLIGKATHLDHLIIVNPVGLHDATGGIGSIGG